MGGADRHAQVFMYGSLFSLALFAFFANRHQYLLIAAQPACVLSGRLWTAADGSFGVDRVSLPRVYHINAVLQLKGTDLNANDDATFLQKCSPRLQHLQCWPSGKVMSSVCEGRCATSRVRVVLDAGGIKRLELDDPVDSHHRATTQPLSQAAHQLRSRISALEPKLRHVHGPKTADDVSRTGDDRV